jgi:Xaa-Pro aminopeptidase
VVLTIEPGIYIPEEGIGIRIEDVVLLTKDGPVVLSRGIPRTVQEIENAMRN